MTNGWKFWVSEIDEDQGCPEEGRFIFQDKFCGNPVNITELNGHTVSYSGGYYAPNELLYVPVATNKALTFTVSAVTNCNLCICSSCSTTAYPEDNAGKFKSHVSYDAGQVAYMLSGSNPYFSAAQLSTISILYPIYFDCSAADVQCP